MLRRGRRGDGCGRTSASGRVSDPNILRGWPAEAVGQLKCANSTTMRNAAASETASIDMYASDVAAHTFGCECRSRAE